MQHLGIAAIYIANNISQLIEINAAQLIRMHIVTQEWNGVEWSRMECFWLIKYSYSCSSSAECINTENEQVF